MSEVQKIVIYRVDDRDFDNEASALRFLEVTTILETLNPNKEWGWDERWLIEQLLEWYTVEPRPPLPKRGKL